MFTKISTTCAIFYFLVRLLIPGQLDAQSLPDQHNYSKSMQAYDSAIASRIPELALPSNLRNRTLPAFVDNSRNKYFSGIYSQEQIASCQQYCSVRYIFSYEINRLRNLDGKKRQNGYSALYTYNFGNEGSADDGVSKFFSWDVLRQQGQMNDSRYPNDHDSTLLFDLWVTGYDNYFEGMHNRVKNIWSIHPGTEEGILTLKNWIYDHLDGSPTGGVAGFSAWSPSTSNMRNLPEGTPEAGKVVIISWPGPAVHGMVLVGYNDSIRYDLNNDGKFTNNLDVNGNGAVTPADWEVGAFIMANCFGDWWANQGYAYVMYSAMCQIYGSGGTWNERVYVVEPDTAYKPRLTVRATITFDSRNKISLRAGIAADTNQPYPDYYLDFPIFHFQGGDYPMQGGQGLPGDTTLELGLDISTLLSFATPGKPLRLFFEVEERDPYNIAEGMIDQVSFMDYTHGVHEIPSLQHDVEIKKNGITRVSAAGTINFEKPEITTEVLPACQPGTPWSAQVNASGGKKPYSWSLERNFKTQETDSLFTEIQANALHIEDSYRPYARIILPFHFQFCGGSFDTLYVNQYGFVTFDPQTYPYPFVRDEEELLRICRCISPAFSINHVSVGAQFAWYESSPGKVIIGWKLIFPTKPGVLNNFELILYADGKFEFRYGDMIEPGPDETTYSGYSVGDNDNMETWANRDIEKISHKSFLFIPEELPQGIEITEDGLLSLTITDSSRIYEITVKVTDADRISTAKTFGLSDGLQISETFVSDHSPLLTLGEPGYFDIELANTGASAISNLTLQLIPIDSTVHMSDSISSVAGIDPGQTIRLTRAFAFSLDHFYRDNYLVPFRIKAVSGQIDWTKDISVNVHTPVIGLSQPVIDDGANSILEPGETAELVIDLNNSGSGDASDLIMHPVTGDSLIEIISQPDLSTDTLHGFLSREVRFLVKGARNALPGSRSNVLLSVESKQLGVQHFPFSVMIGKIPVGICNLTGNSTSAAVMDTILDNLQVAHRMLDSIPTDPSDNGSLFVILGNSPSGAYTLSDTDDKSLSTYLLKGGNLYLESYYAQWLSGLNKNLYKKFHYAYEFGPVYKEDQLFGIGGTFTDSMHFECQTSFPYNVYNFIPKSPAYGIFRNGDTAVRMLQIVYDGEDYKTIASEVEFGLLTDSVEPSTKFTLMKRYLGIFDINLDGIYNYFHADSRDICNGGAVDFSDDSYDNIISRSWEFPGGQPTQSNEKNPVIHYPSPGEYDVRLTVTDGIHSRTVLKKSYIRVKSCSSYDPEGKIAILYPNPSTGTLHIRFLSGMGENFTFVLFDLGGRKLLEREIKPTFPGETFNFDISFLRAGLYIIKTNSSNYSISAKIIVQ